MLCSQVEMIRRRRLGCKLGRFGGISRCKIRRAIAPPGCLVDVRLALPVEPRPLWQDIMLGSEMNAQVPPSLVVLCSKFQHGLVDSLAQDEDVLAESQ